MSMIEKMARAIADNIGPPFDKLHKNKQQWKQYGGRFEGEPRDVNGPFQDDCIEAAKAVLTELEEPSDVMVRAAAILPGAFQGTSARHARARETFTAMIRAAKGEQS